MKLLEELPDQFEMVELHCQLGNHKWQRKRQRGRKPHSCPECLARAERNNPPQTMDDRRELAAHAREIRQQKRDQAAEQVRAEAQARREAIAARLPNVDRMWNIAFDKAMETNAEEDWRRCEDLLKSYMGNKVALNREN